MKPFGLGRASRIRKRPDFERAYETGTRVHGALMTVFFVANDHQRSRLGIAATRKIGSAVVRNKAKRLAREMFRRHRLQAGVDIVVVPRRDMVGAPFSRLEAEFLAILDRRNNGRRGQGRPAQPRVPRRPDRPQVL
jgi:ribonuclease P protein component